MTNNKHFSYLKKIIKLYLVVNLVLATIGLSACQQTTESKSTSAQQLLNDKTKLWCRLRKNYNITTKKQHTEDNQNNQHVEKYVKQYAREEKRLIRITHQASPYLYYVIDQLEKRNLPGELALLPMIESAYLPHITSPKGAAGLWQFIPGTGKLYGLKQNQWYDGRRDVTASTLAALNYLQYLHEEFDQDWLLALAAYNAGPGTIHKAIKKNLKLGRPTTFWALNLSKETREYVPRFLALAEIMANPEKHAITLPDLENKPYFVSVHTGLSTKHRDFKKIASMADVDLAELKRLNPAHKKGSIHPNAPKELLLPVENAEKLEYNLTKNQQEKTKSK